MSEEHNIAKEESMLPYHGKPWLTFLHDVLQRRLDPKDKIPHSRFLSLAMFVEEMEEGEENRERCAISLGSAVIDYMREGTVEQTEKFFGDMLKLKRNFEQVPRREYYAWLALENYWKETGQPPTDRQLREYMQHRRDVYRDQPSPDSPWTELWRDSGLREFFDNQGKDLEEVSG